MIDPDDTQPFSRFDEDPEFEILEDELEVIELPTARRDG